MHGQCSVLLQFLLLNITVWEYLVYVWILTTFFAVLSWFIIEKPILKKVR